MDPRQLHAGVPLRPSDEVTLDDVGRMLRRDRKLIAGITAAVLLAAVLFTWLQTPIYEGEATVHVRMENGRGSGLASELGSIARVAGLGRGAASGIGTDILIMQSRRIVEAVVDSLALHVEILHPNVPRSSLFSVVDASPDATPAIVHLELRDDNNYSVNVEWAAGEISHPDIVAIGRLARLGDVSVTLNPELSESGLPRRISFEVKPFRRSVSEVRRELHVEQQVAGTEIIALRHRNRDPVLAAAVPNAVTDGFLRYKTATGRAESRSRASFLRSQVALYEAELASAEARLQRFRERERIVSIEGQATEQVRRYAQLQARRDELKEERDALQRLLAAVRGRSSRNGADEKYRELAAFPVFFGNPTIQNIIRSLIALEDERAKLLVQRTEQNIDVLGINQRISELELQLLETAENYLDSRNNQMASLDATLAEFSSELTAVPAREVEFERLRRQQELLSAIHRQLETGLREAEVEEAVEPLNVQLLDPALVPVRPASPRPLINLIIGTLLGLSLGIGAAFARRAMDTKVHSRNDIQLASGGLPVVATIPRIGLSLNGSSNGTKSLHSIRTRKLPAPAMSTLVARDAPRSQAAEAYRALRTRIVLRDGEDPTRCIVIASASVGDGKTTTAANLAIALAQQGLRTLLIDADLRKGHLHQLFQLERVPGLCELLRDQSSSSDAARATEIADGNLSVLPSGEYPEYPSELIGSERMRLVLSELLTCYDRIVIDTPPLSYATDAAVLCVMPSTAVLLVARAEFSDRNALEHVSHELQALGVHVGGIIVNDIATPDAAGYGYAG